MMSRKAAWGWGIYIALVLLSNGFQGKGTPKGPYRVNEPHSAVPIVVLHINQQAREAWIQTRLDGQEPWFISLQELGAGTISTPLSYATQFEAWAKQNGITKVHLIACGKASATAAYLADSTASLTLINALGVQELELLGDHFLNRGLYGLNLLFAKVLHYGIPHFGVLEGVLPDIKVLEGYYRMDLRPLREQWLTYPRPVLILHGEQNLRVPVSVAYELYRILPQSDWELFTEAGHELVADPPAEVVNAISLFIAQAEDGAALIRSNALPERVAMAEKPFDPSLLPRFSGEALWMVFLLLVLSSLVSEDLTCIGAGLMVANGNLSFSWAVFACMSGIFVGDVGLFLAGKYIGRPLIKVPPFKWLISQATLTRCETWFQRRGAIVIFASRFTPGLRLGTYVTAGLAKMKLSSFVVYFLLAAALWTPIIVGLATWLGGAFLAFLNRYHHYTWWIVLLFVLAWVLIEKICIPSFTHVGRRLLVSRWRRLTHWEYWSAWVLYIPVTIYGVLLGIRYRKITLFTLCNPGIPLGGLVGESKGKILDLIQHPSVARYHLIHRKADYEERLREAHAFMQLHKLGFPVVLKPDVGQRGSGVHIVRSEKQLQDVLKQMTRHHLIQEYIPGKEYGVFYYRYPHEVSGTVYSVTDKRFTAVTGDGIQTLEELILNDERAVAQAKLYFEINAHRLDQVPASGERISLVEIGSHCRGTLFLDGRHLITPELTRSIEEISQTVDGFYFGRYDIRVPSEESFKKGEQLRVIELNGVSSEATHMYDPSLSIWNAYKTLFEQYRIAFEIGHQNRCRGDRPIGHRRFIRALRRKLGRSS